MECARPECEETESRVDGYCSNYCQDVHFLTMYNQALKQEVDDLKAKIELQHLDLLRLQKESKSGMKIGPLSLYCPFCSWDEKSQGSLANHMLDKHEAAFFEVVRARKELIFGRHAYPARKDGSKMPIDIMAKETVEAADKYQAKAEKLDDMIRRMMVFLEANPPDSGGAKRVVTGVQVDVAQEPLSREEDGSSCPVCGTHTGTHWHDYCPRWNGKRWVKG